MNVYIVSYSDGKHKRVDSIHSALKSAMEYAASLLLIHFDGEVVLATCPDGSVLNRFMGLCKTREMAGYWEYCTKVGDKNIVVEIETMELIGG